PRAGLLVGVDSGPGMLEAFASRAEVAAVDHREVAGQWPDVAAACPAADVVVCHHVLYNVAELIPFSYALTARARERVVVELTGVHPLVWMAPIWEGIHGSPRPRGPSADDASQALRDAGINLRQTTWRRPFTLAQGTEDAVVFLRRRLCVGADRDAEIRALLAEHPPPDEREVATLWWDGAAT
ncbi:MAG: SAM-dependent methyltransferase, partial [Actinomycetota bacterium]|nr:SAM-dependent methyltransferase [Actinomycetota bacterium]